MTKSKIKPDSFQAISGITTKSLKEQVAGQESIETLEGGKYMPELKKETAEKAKKKNKGRPKTSREKKKQMTFTILPSNYDQASKVAYVYGKSVSELIDDFLADFVRKNMSKLIEYEELTKGE